MLNYVAKRQHEEAFQFHKTNRYQMSSQFPEVHGHFSSSFISDEK